MNKNDSYHYFFDTNFLREVSSKENEEYVKWILKLLLNPKNGKVTAVFTPFAKFEALGLTVPTFNYQIPSSDLSPNKLVKIIADLQHSIKDHLLQSDNLQTDHILHRVEEMRKRTHPDFIKSRLFAVHFELDKKNVDSYRDELIQQLIQGMTHGYPFPKQIRQYLNHIGYDVFFSHLASKSNVSFLRLLTPLSARAISLSKKKFTELKLKKLTEAIAFKNYADFVDFEILHYAMFGYVDENQKNNSVICFTSDKYSERLLNRVAIFKSLVRQLLKNQAREEKDISFSYDLAAGQIVKLDPLATERSIIDVRFVKPVW
ncbi:MAG: hypothetical protein V4654_04460 [Bdellovibrionota bacterium]